MSGSDPFDERPNRTVFRQSPLPQKAAPTRLGPAPTPRQSGPDDDIAQPPTPRRYRNLPLDGAQRILALVAAVQAGRSSRDLGVLREQAVAELAAYSDLLLRSRLAPNHASGAMFAVCATVDHVVQNHPDFANNDWPVNSMVVSFFEDSGGGRAFWDQLSGLLAYPNENQDVLELYYVCMAVGFEGVLKGDRRELAEARRRAFNALSPAVRHGAAELSPHWRGAPTAPPRFGPYFPALMAVVFIVVIASVSFLSLHWSLGLSTAAARAAMLKPFGRGGVVLGREVTPIAVPEDTVQLTRINGCLGGLLSGDLETRQDANNITIRTRNGALFDSNSAALAPGVNGANTRMMDTIASCLDREAGAVKVMGHSDTDPISGGVFRSNLELSRVRAGAAGDILRRAFHKPDRVTTDGAGDGYPLDTADTPAAKARNRRVEFLLTRDH